jgi:hypothetical protein
MSKKRLRFDNLSDRHAGVTPAFSSSYDEAARACLGRHYAPPQDISVVDAGEAIVCEANWREADQRACSAWANETDATEAGAYGLSLAAIDMTRGLVAVSRAETLTGADYYLGNFGEAFEDLETSYRLEVSGMNRATGAEIAARLRKKKEQAVSGASNLPAIASVVAFSSLMIISEDVE